jgi:hypothetical protein
MLNILESNAPKNYSDLRNKKLETQEITHMDTRLYTVRTGNHESCHVTRGPRTVQAYRTLGFKFLATWPTRKTKQAMGEETGSYNADWMRRVADRIQRRAVVLVVLHIRTMELFRQLYYNNKFRNI